MNNSRLLIRSKGSTPADLTAGDVRRVFDYRSETIVFDVVDLPLLYNGILGRQALAKFMAASHYAYNTLKMPGPMGVISIPSDKKEATICMEKMYREVVAAEPTEDTAPAEESKKNKKS